MKTLIKILITTILTVIMVTPALFVAGAYGLIQPIGFLQSFFVIGAGVWLLGWTQFVMFAIWLGLMIWMWFV